MYEFYKVDKDGNPKEYFQSNNINESNDYVILASNITDYNYPKWDFRKKAWYEGGITPSMLEDLKTAKKQQLSLACQEDILSGFKLTINDRIYDFSYSVEKQQNFSDTMRLFDNNMIDNIGWNAYLGDEKVRLQLNKKDFTKVYLAGVQHKMNAITRLNDVLYPMVDAAKNKETIARIYWDTGLPAEELKLDESKTIPSELSKLERRDAAQDETAMMTMMALMEMSMSIK